MKECIKVLIPIVNFIKSFSKNEFQGKVSYHKIPKNVMLSDLFTYFSVILFLSNKKNNNYIIVDKYYSMVSDCFNNVKLSEQGIIDLYLFINKQDYYPRNVNLMSFIIYKENWNVYDFNKFKNTKNYINKCYKSKEVS